MKNLYIASDHAGFELKQTLVKSKALCDQVTFVDLGPNDGKQSVDYPDFAEKLAEQIISHPGAKGVLLCGSGIGMSIAANRHPEVRAALVFNEEFSKLAASHNQANVLCLPARFLNTEEAVQCVNAWLNTPADESERHQRRVDKMAVKGRDSAPFFWVPLRYQDQKIFDSIQRERVRQEEGLELIASENYVSRAVLEAQGSVLTNKYAEGYPGKRYYGGCEVVDEAENLAIQRICQVFNVEAANVQPHSGSQANMAAYFSLLKPGDKILGMSLSHGGHLTHGSPVNFSGKLFHAVHYGIDPTTHRIDYHLLREQALKEKPQAIVAGASAYPRIIDFETMGKIAQEVGCPLIVDMAHIAGLVATGHHPSPVGHAALVTSTTHKTLRGPRGGIILGSAERIKPVQSQIFPGIQGGPLMHVIAAKAVAFEEALRPEFKTYQNQVLLNAKALATSLMDNGFHLVSGGTDNHLMLVDLTQFRDGSVSGKDAETWLNTAHITVNKNTIPNEKRSPFVTSGLRIGVPAVTSRGMKEAEMKAIGSWIASAVESKGNSEILGKISNQIKTLCKAFPIYSGM